MQLKFENNSLKTEYEALKVLNSELHKQIKVKLKSEAKRTSEKIVCGDEQASNEKKEQADTQPDSNVDKSVQTVPASEVNATTEVNATAAALVTQPMPIIDSTNAEKGTTEATKNVLQREDAVSFLK